MIRITVIVRHLVFLSFVALLIGLPVKVFADDATDPGVDRRWLDRLNRIDRELLDELIGYAPPAFIDELMWYEQDALKFEQLRGKVVVIQSFTSANTAGRNLPQRIGKLLSEFSADDVQLIALHTPQKADMAGKFLEKRKYKMPVVVDSSGVWCDALGIYKKPVNVVIDRQGEVRYAGLNRVGLNKAVAKLIEQKFDAQNKPNSRPVDQTPAAVPFPPYNNPVGNANDLRGKTGPDLYVSQWITPAPDITNKVIVVEFWATWCGPCVANIPHMNKLAMEFTSDVAIIGVSAETENRFLTGMEKLVTKGRIKRNAFQYALALDPTRQMQQKVRHRSIPHAIVMSADRIVRWQGYPPHLTVDILKQIVQANKALAGTSGSTSARRGRWTSNRAP